MTNSKIYSERFISNGVTPAINISAKPCSKWAILVRGSGMAATAWQADLEVGLNGSSWTSVATHNTATGDGVTVFAVDKPATFYRINLTGLTLAPAGALYVYVLGMS